MSRPASWNGNLIVQTLLAGGPIANVIQLTPTVTSAAIQDALHEVTWLHISVERILTTAIDACGFVVWKGKVDVGTSTPAQSLNPLNLVALEHADSDIMMEGLLNVPPVIFDAAGTPAVNRELRAHKIHIPVARKFSRVNHGIFLAIACDVSSVVRVSVLHRTYLSYG